MLSVGVAVCLLVEEDFERVEDRDKIDGCTHSGRGYIG